jgi:hypothetical protein
MTTDQLAASVPDTDHSWMLVGCPRCLTISGVIFFDDGRAVHVGCNWEGTVKDLWQRLLKPGPYQVS